MSFNESKYTPERTFIYVHCTQQNILNSGFSNIKQIPNPIMVQENTYLFNPGSLYIPPEYYSNLTLNSIIQLYPEIRIWVLDIDSNLSQEILNLVLPDKLFEFINITTIVIEIYIEIINKRINNQIERNSSMNEDNNYYIPRKNTTPYFKKVEVVRNKSPIYITESRHNNNAVCKTMEISHDDTKDAVSILMAFFFFSGYDRYRTLNYRCFVNRTMDYYSFFIKTVYYIIENQIIGSYPKGITDKYDLICQKIQKNIFEFYVTVYVQKHEIPLFYIILYNLKSMK